MGDGLKILKDKRHRSSSSLAGTLLDATRSDRRLDIKASIPEMQDQFATAEERCDDLQDKLDLIKSLKKKRKLKKRSMTRVTEQGQSESNPFITVKTQPKKKVQPSNRLRRLEAPNPARGYLDPATVEQHRMLGHVRGYNQTYKPQLEYNEGTQDSMEIRPHVRLRQPRVQAEGDITGPTYKGQGVQINTSGPLDKNRDYYDSYDQPPEQAMINVKKAERRSLKSGTRRRHTPRDVLQTEANEADPGSWRSSHAGSMAPPSVRQQQRSYVENKHDKHIGKERSVVELFTKKDTHDSRPLGSAPQTQNKVPETDYVDESYEDHEAKAEFKKAMCPPTNHPRRPRLRTRRYELPTVASQMKQTGGRLYIPTTQSNIPFVVTKSTTPSHNIGVNIQQVLNGLKIQQPLSGIPLTIAHHMGLRHIPERYSMKPSFLQPALDHREINAIKLGRRLVRLPSYKYMSYNRLLSLYREGDGMVPRFLKALSRPHYFYSSMYNLPTHHNDFDGSKTKIESITPDGGQEAKQSLEEYARLYRQYEKLEKKLKEKYDPELEKRKQELTRELAAREEHIRSVVQQYRSGDTEQLRASASAAEEGYHRRSSYKLDQ